MRAGLIVEPDEIDMLVGVCVVWQIVEKACTLRNDDKIYKLL